MVPSRREYEADVYYEVWRSGGNPEAIDLDRVDDAYRNGWYEDEAASQELRIQAAARVPGEEV